MLNGKSKLLLVGAALILLTSGVTTAPAQEKKEADASPVGVVKGTFFLGAFE